MLIAHVTLGSVANPKNTVLLNDYIPPRIQLPGQHG